MLRLPRGIRLFGQRVLLRCAAGGGAGSVALLGADGRRASEIGGASSAVRFARW